MATLMSARQSATAAAIRGSSNRLSPIGRYIERLANYIRVVVRDARLDARFHRCRMVSGIVPAAHPLDALVYDVGANNGDDTEYYLRLGLRVAVIEANPGIAKLLRNRFSNAISQARAFIVEAAVVDDDRTSIDFYVDETKDKLSSAERPSSALETTREVRVNACRLSQLITVHGSPYYVKIDVEGLDKDVPTDIFRSGLRSPFVSAESHAIEVLCQLVEAGYRRFKVVEGRHVDSRYYQPSVGDPDAAPSGHRFRAHSSGPFGEDIPGSWMTADEIFAYLAEYGLGRKDIHAAW